MGSSECRICELLERGALKVNGSAAAALYDKPVTADHVIVAPARHVTAISDLSLEEAARIGELIKELAGELEGKDDVNKVYVLAIGDVCPHFHFHLIPRRNSFPNLGPFVFGTNSWGARVREINE